MEKFKQDIYDMWGKQNAQTFPTPTPQIISERTDYYQKAVVGRFSFGDKRVRILDLGCGYGFFLHACKKLGYQNVVGVEVIGACVEFARKTFGISTIANGQMQDFLTQQGDESFGIITAFDVMEHIKKDQLVDLLKLIYQKLHNGGRFIMQSPNGGSAGGLYIFHSDITHEMPFTDILAKELLLMAGFSSVEVFGEYRQSNFKNWCIDALRVPFSMLMGFKNPYAFSTNIVIVAKKHA